MLAVTGTGERVCWTRMQTEAGQELGRIVRRKELERRAGNGLFFWGVGNPPSRAIPRLARAAAAIDVLFSVMKSRPKAEDVSPALVVAWRGYVDPDGVVRPVPENVLVTSRAARRGCHYALMCRSDAPLVVADGGPFDPAAFRNIGAGGAVGASQVTALLERHAPDGPSEYRVAMRARLTGGLWVKLVDPVALTNEARAVLDAEFSDELAWLDAVRFVRRRDMPMSPAAAQPALFAI
jgi:hypothetical protein